MTSQVRLARGVGWLVPLLVLLVPAVARCETPPSPRSTRLLATTSKADTPVVANPFTVVVTGSRQSIPLRLNPAATTVIGAATLARMPRGTALEEALFTLPGARVDNQADGERVHLSVRGQGILTERGIRGIKVLMDGLPLNDPTGIAPDLYDVDWSTVNRLELLRGPAAALYGGGGSGGVLNLFTADPAEGGAP